MKNYVRRCGIPLFDHKVCFSHQWNSISFELVPPYYRIFDNLWFFMWKGDVDKKDSCGDQEYFREVERKRREGVKCDIIRCIVWRLMLYRPGRLAASVWLLISCLLALLVLSWYRTINCDCGRRYILLHHLQLELMCSKDSVKWRIQTRQLLYKTHKRENMYLSK